MFFIEISLRIPKGFKKQPHPSRHHVEKPVESGGSPGWRSTRDVVRAFLCRQGFREKKTIVSGTGTFFFSKVLVPNEQ